MNVTRMLFAQVIYKPGYDTEMCRNVQCAEIYIYRGFNVHSHIGLCS